MELRRDPVGLHWVIQEDGEASWPEGQCPLCRGHESLSPQTLYEHTNGDRHWQVRVTPHLRPLYRIEGEAQRRGEGLYDKMRNLGAHEIVVESPSHDVPLSQQSDEQVAQVLKAFVARITDLKKDPRFRYVLVSRDQGHGTDQELSHPHSQITALPFIPRQVVYELRTVKRHFELKERCLFCDIAKQELDQQVRTVEWDDRYIAFCPFASRAPYETWILPLTHHSAFEEDLTGWQEQVRLGRFLKSILRRIEATTPAYHLVLHTAPNMRAKYEKPGHWATLEQDFHWHFEILPNIPSGSRSYKVQEVYYNSVLPETAAQRLRSATVAEEIRR